MSAASPKMDAAPNPKSAEPERVNHSRREKFE